jgi:hypothetical protein
MLQRNSLLATTAVIVVLALVVVRLNHHNAPSAHIEKKSTPIGTTSIVDQKGEPTHQSAARSPLDGNANSRSSAERSASEHGRSTPKLPAGNPTASESTAPLLNSGHLKGVRTPNESGTPQGPAGWNLPAATNAPAAIEARAPWSSASQFNSAPSEPAASFNLARREVVPPPVNTIVPRQPVFTNGAAFQGGIEKVPFEVPR